MSPPTDPRTIRGGVPALRAPEQAQNDVVVLILDSCRYDTLVRADLPSLRALGPIQRRFSYATWTAPSHYNLLMGLLPFPAVGGPPHLATTAAVSAWPERLGLPDTPGGFTAMLPSLWLPDWLGALGMECHARVSMPVLNPATPLNRGFHSFVQADHHNDLHSIVDTVSFVPGRPRFWLINTGETHYPYVGKGDAAPDLPHLPGLNGVFRALSEGRAITVGGAFSPELLRDLHARQVHAARNLDGAIQRLLDMAPAGTRVIVTSDHGELFGEAGLFGHGPVPHDKVLEVPYVEGTVSS